jgi:poly-gamma-glutamate synthesis protein (capsule biosynthesis protein)
LANNHILDYGVEGMHETMKALNQHNIRSVGAGDNLQQAREGITVQTDYGVVALLSYSLTFPESFWATDERPGTAFGHEKEIVQDIKRHQKHADHIIVSFHWGREKTFTLRPYQPKLARAAIDAGANVVLGHHPHVLQAVEQYKQGIIIYSLGNYVFGSYSKDADTSVIARITLHNNRFHSAEFIPINVLNTEVVFQPAPLKGRPASKVIKHINKLSKSQNTRLNLINNRGYLHSRSNKIQSLASSN